jgi:Tfp pilus assembly protein PilX
MRIQEERGVALFLALILMSALSVLTVSMMFLSQSESFASSNYRLMTQSRYGAEAGVQKAVDYITNSDGLATKYNINTSNVLLGGKVSPVQYLGNNVVLSSDPSVTSNYPDLATINTFQAATTGQLAAGNSTITYTTTATLLGIDSFTDAYTTNQRIVQTWSITSNATIAGIRKSTVQVSAIIDSPKFPAISYGAFGTDPGCGSLQLQGSVSTDSYASFGMGSSSSPAISNSGGDVGSNGNIDFNGGGVDVHGNLATPRTGVGNCTANAVSACSGNLSECTTSSLVQLPAPVPFPTPTIPPYSTTGPFSATGGDPNPTTGSCFQLGLVYGTNCTVQMGSGGNPDYIVVWNTPSAAIPPASLSLPSISLTGNVELLLLAPPTGSTNISNQFDINSISLSGNGSIGMDTDHSGHGVVVNVVGKTNTGADITGDVIHFDGNTGGSNKGTWDGLVDGFNTVQPGGTNCGAACTKYDASNLQFVYGGDKGTIFMKGNANAAATLYAPNANATFQGSVSFYGSLIAKKLTLAGNFVLNYDSSLAAGAYTAGNPMISSFSWKKY